MLHCMVHLCTNISRKTQDMGISYHRLPRRPLKGVWLREEEPAEASELLSAVVTLNQTVLNRLGKYVATKSQKL